MIPRYPLSKRLELSDCTEVNALTRRFAPYSDFNFVSLWSWNTTESCSVATLNGNLVIRMSDYISGLPFYSFIGDGAPTETAIELARRMRSEGLGSNLRLVPEFVAHRLDRTGLTYDMDMDGSDYVLSTARLQRFEGQTFRTKRKEANRFVRERPEHRVEHLDLSSRATTASLLKLFARWAHVKGTGEPFELLEFRAFQRLLRAVDFLPDLHGLGVFVDGEMVAFAVIELVQQRYAMGHFMKADATLPGVYSFLMREIGEFLAASGYEHLNTQQDLGLPGLRQNKSSYIPAAYLRKYNVAERVAASRRPSRPALLSIPAPSDALLTTVAPEAFGPTLTLRPPSLSPDLLDLAREEEDRERRSVRQSRITVAREPHDDEHESNDHPRKSSLG